MSQARHLIIGTFSFAWPLLEWGFFCVSVCGKNSFSVRDDHKDVVDHCCETAQERPNLHIWMQRYGYYITSPTPWLWWAFLVKCSLMWSHIQLNFHECYLVAAILQEWITTNRLFALCGAGWGFLRHRIRAQVLAQGTRLLHIALSLSMWTKELPRITSFRACTFGPIWYMPFCIESFMLHYHWFVPCTPFYLQSHLTVALYELCNQYGGLFTLLARLGPPRHCGY